MNKEDQDRTEQPDTLSDSTANLLRVANRESPPSHSRVRLLIALPVTIVLLVTVMAGVYFWLVDAYFGTGATSEHAAKSQQEFASDWLLLLLIFNLGGAIIGFVIAYSITAPIRRIIALSEKVAGGDLRHKVDVQRTDEVGVLGSSFNHMVEALNSFFENRNRFVLESFSGGLITTDFKGSVTAVNSAAERMLGLHADQVEGQSASRLLDAEGLEELRAVYEEGVWKGDAIVGREVMVTANGQSRRFSVNSSPMRDRDGKVFGVIINFRDLQDVQRFYEQMKRADRLATMGTFATGLAHEIRNPLGAIKGTAQLLAEDVKDMPRAGEYARVIVKEVNRLDDLVREVQAYSHPTAQREPTDVVRLCADTVALARNNPKSILRNGVQISENYQTLPVTQLSKDKVSQALVNILINALQHTPEHGVVEVETKYEEGDALPLRILVANTGAAIPEDQIDHVFEPFYSTRPGGSGLGLSIAYQVITHHGGEILVRNEDNKVCFVIKLPVGSADGN
ncbi:MAG: sensor histidine kinase [Candidatus Sumerlaeaceae bacterium]